MASRATKDNSQRASAADTGRTIATFPMPRC
jgi:hypothetical protein